MHDNTNTYPRRRRVSDGLIAQGVAAAIGAGIITFNRDHSLLAGSMALTVAYFLFLPGQILVTTGWAPKTWPFRTGWMGIAVSAITAAGMLWFWLSDGVAGPPVFFVALTGWAAVTALVGIVAGWPQTDRALTRDFLTMAGLTALLAIIEAVVPMTDIYVVGIAGAYLAVFAVYAIISGLSVRFARSVPLNG